MPWKAIRFLQHLPRMVGGVSARGQCCCCVVVWEAAAYAREKGRRCPLLSVWTPSTRGGKFSAMHKRIASLQAIQPVRHFTYSAPHSPPCTLLQPVIIIATSNLGGGGQIGSSGNGGQLGRTIHGKKGTVVLCFQRFSKPHAGKTAARQNSRPINSFSIYD